VTQHQKHAADSDIKAPGNKKSGELKGNEDNCRCKEVSKKTLPEMIKLMIRDLTFRKK